MHIRYKSILIYLTFFTLAFSFPIQVLISSPYPALLPYFFLGILYFIAFIEKGWSLKIWHFNNGILINIYLLLVLSHTFFQLFFDLISLYKATSAIIIFALPVLFYIYFYYYASNRQVRTAFLAIFINGIVIGIFFVLDSYLMLVFGIVSDYSYAVMDYISLRSISEDGIENIARISPFGRSHGLLEKHIVSASWVVFSCISLLSLFNFNNKIRVLFLLIYTLILLICLNFTSLVSFLITVIFLLSFINRYFIKNILFFTILIVSIFIFLYLIDINYVKIIKLQIETQISILTDKENIAIPGGTYFGNLINDIINYPNIAKEYPFGLFFGDGFSEPGYPKGGDYGIVESLHRFGPTMFLLVYVGLAILIIKVRKNLNKTYPSDNNYVGYCQFSVCIILYILITELHYSIWYSKSIFPIFFMSLALLERYKILKINNTSH
jgi:hypothetical protein